MPARTTSTPRRGGSQSTKTTRGRKTGTLPTGPSESAPAKRRARGADAAGAKSVESGNRARSKARKTSPKPRTAKARHEMRANEQPRDTRTGGGPRASTRPRDERKTKRDVPPTTGPTRRRSRSGNKPGNAGNPPLTREAMDRLAERRGGGRTKRPKSAASQRTGTSRGTRRQKGRVT